MGEIQKPGSSKEDDEYDDPYGLIYKDLDGIVVTHVKDPNRIFAYKVQNNLAARESIDVLEDLINTSYIPELSKNYAEPDVDDVVALYHPTWEKHIRADLDYIEVVGEQRKFRCWAKDYGIPVETNLVSHIKPLTLDLKQHMITIYEICLTLCPIYVRHTTDFLIRLQQRFKWPRDATELCQNLLSSSEYELKLLVQEYSDLVCYGDIYMKKKNTGRVYSLKDMMIQHNVADGIEVNEYQGCEDLKKRRQGIPCNFVGGMCRCIPL